MQFYSQPLPNGRFGIYVDSQLLATIGCSQSCRKMIKVLQQRHLGACIAKSAQAEVTRYGSDLMPLQWHAPVSVEQVQQGYLTQYAAQE